MEDQLLCGAAVGDITPKDEELSGLEALMRKKFGGILDPLHVRVIFLKNGVEQALFVCFELDKAPYPGKYIKEISDEFQIPETSIFMLAVHAHAVPITGDRIYDGPNNIDQKPLEVVETTHAYEKRIHEVVMNTVRNALMQLQPVSMKVSTTESYINTDRRRTYITTDADGVRHEILGIGNEPLKEIDHTLTEISFQTKEDRNLAVLLHYPVHCTIMHGNSAMYGKMGISADLAGRTSTLVEKRFPGAVCMWISGAAGNINPVMQCEMTYPDPESGRPMLEYLPGDMTGMLRNLSNIHYKDVMEGLIRTDFTEDAPEPVHAVKLCQSEGKREDYVVRLHMMKLGQLYFLSVSGELYSSYVEKLKERLKLSNLIVINHDCSNDYDSGYIPDVETLKAEKVQLPGVGENMNMVPQKFEEALLRDAEVLYRMVNGLCTESDIQSELASAIE